MTARQLHQSTRRAATVIDALGEALITLDPASEVPFTFSSWKSCTCGHLYRAVSGKRDIAGPRRVTRERTITEESVTRDPDELYIKTLQAIVEANDLHRLMDEIRQNNCLDIDDPKEVVHLLTWTVSDATNAVAKGLSPDAEDDGRHRHAAIHLIEVALQAEQTHYRAMLTTLQEQLMSLPLDFASPDILDLPGREQYEREPALL